MRSKGIIVSLQAETIFMCFNFQTYNVPYMSLNKAQKLSRITMHSRPQRMRPMIDTLPQEAAGAEAVVGVEVEQDAESEAEV
jgi:hypothetical protein